MSKKMYIFLNIDSTSFLKTITNNSIDLVFTDPPYIISRKTSFKSLGKKSVERFAISMDFGEWDNTNLEEHIALMRHTINEYYRVLRNGGTCIIWYDLWKIESLKCWLEDAGFKQIRLIEWVKTNPVPINSSTNYLTNSREVAVLGVKGGKSTFHSKYDNGIYYSPIHRDGGKRLHPCQKPISVTSEIIKKHSNEGDIVLDSFAGSGTTLVCAKNLHRFYFGCEIDKNYYDLGFARISSTTSLAT